MPKTIENNQEDNFSKEKSLGELWGNLTREMSALMRQEVQLARVETTQKISAAVKGMALLIVAGILGFVAFEALIVAAILALAQAVNPWIAALIVGVGLLIVAGILALLGVRGAKKIADPVPHQTVETLKEDTQWLKEKAQ